MQLSRIDLSVLYQPFRRKVEALIQACNVRGSEYWATCGLRTHDEQDALYARGRTVPPLGHVVTQARGGQSPHQFGVAVDFCLDADPLKPGLQPDYKESHYKVLAEEAAKLGLVSGLTWNSSFKDAPHIQWPVKQMGFNWARLDAEYRRGGLEAVYRLFDEWQAKNGTI